MNRRFLAFVAVLVFLLAGKPFSPKILAQSPKPTVYVTTYTLESFTQAIAGDQVEVKNFLPAGADLHSWEPTARDMAALSEADLLIVNGAGLEPWLEKVTVVLDPSKVIDSSLDVDLLPAIGFHDHDDDREDDHHYDHGVFDPHFWVDPHEAEEQAEVVYEALVRLLQDDRRALKVNYEILVDKLGDLQDKADGLEDGPGRAFVVTHGGFRYLADRYDLEQLALNVADHSEPSPRELAAIIERAKVLGLKAVLYDSRESSKQAEVVAEAIGGEIVPIQTFEYVSEEERLDGKDYFERMSEMLDTLQAALG